VVRGGGDARAAPAAGHAPPPDDPLVAADRLCEDGARRRDRFGRGEPDGLVQPSRAGVLGGLAGGDRLLDGDRGRRERDVERFAGPATPT
jgi:hypothetical protein